jgi:hypothetical protein
MPAPEKQVRVFISSTFRDRGFDSAQDRHAERNELVKVALPRAAQLAPYPRPAEDRTGASALDFGGIPLHIADSEIAELGSRLAPDQRNC